MPNLITNPQSATRTAVLVKRETGGYGVDATPDGLIDWIEARELTHTPSEDETVDRNIELPYHGNGGTLITAQWSKLSFWVAMAAGGAAGVAPKIAPLLLGCGFAETVDPDTSVTYTPVSDAYGSLSAYAYVHKEWQKMLGMRGELKGSWSAKGHYKLTCELTALYDVPTAVADIPAVDRTGWPIEKAVNAVNTAPIVINGTNLAASAFDWAMGNNIAKISLPGPQLEVAITQRKPTASCTVLAMPLGTFNPYALKDAQTAIALSNVHGTVVGARVKTEIKGTIIGVERTKIENMAAWNLKIEPRAVDGNDEIVLTYF
jgi:hypothetical protein